MKPKLTILVGPPGVGKSTYAKNMTGDICESVIYINQDSQSKQHLDIFKQAVINKKDICLDRMNFDKKQRERYLKLAKEVGYTTEIIVLHESIETCKQRILKRNALGTHETIKTEEDMHRALNFFFSHYERPTEEEADVVTFQYPNLTMKLNAVICDIDGTMANIDHRLNFIRDGKKDWKNFLLPQNIEQDKVNSWCKNITTALRPNHIIVMCSGRPDHLRNTTKQWLETHQIYHDYLFMRPRQDHRQDSIVKEIILDFELLTRFNISFAIDDRKQVVDMWRKRGIVCLACAEGDF